MILTPAQAKIAIDNHRFRVVNCGRRFGKTTLAIEEIKGKALKSKTKIAYIAPTYQQARDIAWEMLKVELAPIIERINGSRLELEVKNLEGTTSIIQLKGWENIETIKGQFFHFVVIDEVAMMKNFWLAWQEYIRPTLTDYRGEALFISTPKGFNHFYELYNLEAEDQSFKAFHFTTLDNPFIPKEEIEESKTQMTEDRFAQEYLADFRKTEGLVYKEFNRDKHIFDEYPEGIHFVESLAGIDFGFTNPAAILHIKKDYTNTYWIDSEWYQRGRTTEELIEALQKMELHIVYPDQAEPDRIKELMDKGFNCREVSKKIPPGISRIRELLKQGRLRVHRSCTHTINEFETYAYPESLPGKPEPEVPIPENNHAMDALRYVIYNNQPIMPNPINDLRINETRNSKSNQYE